MLCRAHSALIGQQLSASHVLLELSNLCQAFSKKFKVLNTGAFSLLPALVAFEYCENCREISLSPLMRRVPL